MTDAAAARPAQSPSMIDTISKAASVKSSSQTARAHIKSGENPNDLDSAGGKSYARDIARNDRSDRRLNGAQIDASGKTSDAASHEIEAEDGADASFEATIEKVGSEPSAGNAPGVSSQSAIWAAEMTPRQMTGANGNGDISNIAGKPAIPGHLLKQASVEALMEAKKRLIMAQDQASAMTDPPAEEAAAAAISVTARETHLLFENVETGSRARVIEALANQDQNLNLTSTSGTAGTEKGQTGIGKASVEGMPAGRMAISTSASDTAPRQNFSGSQNNGSEARHQPTAMAARPPGEQITSAATEHLAESALQTGSNMSSVAQQLRSGVIAALGGDGGPGSLSNPPQFIERPATGYLLRTMDLTLSPPDLGTIRLKLSLKSSALDIDAEASKASTARLLDGDRSGLEQSLRDAGYDVKNLKITDASASSNPNGALNNGASTPQDSSQTRAGFASRHDENMPRRDSETPNQSQHRQRENDHKQVAGSDVGTRRQANAIYI